MSGRRLLIALVVVVAALAAPPSARAQLLSPGPLSAAHAPIDGDDHCGKCHQSGRQVVASLCLSCHEDLGARIRAGAGLHGRQYQSRPCQDCHVEHIGRKTKLVRWPGGAPERLDHDLTGWPLRGGHRPVGCAACHTQKSPQGRTQYLGARPACASCHRDPHAGRLGTDCQRCHGVERWPEVDLRQFDHGRTRFALTGKHRDATCDGCHGTPARWTGIEFSTCDRCHDDPHDGEFAPKACTACHDTEGWDRAAAKMRTQHPGLSLRAGHAKVACQRCHDRGNDRAPSRGAACAGCHRPVHEARFGERCERCHGGIRWLGLADEVGRKAHASTAYPLTGRHATVACARCHPKDRPAAARYRELVFDRCAACHADQHAGQFADRAAGECAGCHTVDGFAPAGFGPTQHATTRFPLDGRHAAAPCAGCHATARPRLDWQQPKRACAECHANPHGTQFAAELAAGGCATCHATGDWRQPRIDHATWPLEGAHATTPCARCHGDASGGAAAAYRGVPRACEGCHDDRHAGQFRQSDPVRTCQACHGTQTFALPAFDHATTAGYALIGKHASAPCAGCHPTTTLRSGETAVRYRLGYRACKDCHANPHREERR